MTTTHDRTPRAFALEDVMLLDPRAIGRAFGPFGDDDEEDCDDGVEIRDGVAIVTIDGPLSQRGGWWWDGYESIEQRMQRALASSATSVLLKINSPGGVVAGCFEAARRMREACIASGKPVVAYADEMACSAAYALACVADEIVLPPSGTVGSIGVIATACDRVKANEINGINVQLVTSGERKADLHPDAPLSESAVAALQARVTHLANLFSDWVASRRGTSSEAVAGLQAAVFDGPIAVSVGLANRVGSLQDALALARTSAIARRAPTPTTGGVSPAPRGIMNPELLALLGLPATASEQDAMTAARASRTVSSQLCALTGQSTPEAAMGAVSTWKTLADKSAALEAKIAKIETEEAERAKAAEATARKTLLDSAVEKGVMSPHERAAYDTDPLLAAVSFSTLKPQIETRLAHAPQVKREPIAPPNGPSKTMLTEAHRTVAKQLGLSEETMQKQVGRSLIGKAGE
jgi:ClpP class serine protease